MSRHRENVIWQSKDGSWNRGFFESYITGDPSDEDYDPEWDVDYDFGAFEWAATGLASPEAANRAWGGANPGGYTQYAYTDASAQQCDEYDAMVAAMTPVLTGLTRGY